MQLSSLPTAHLFAGAGGDICGFQRTGWLRPTFAVEINRHRCRTLRVNHPGLRIFEGPIQAMTLADYPRHPLPCFFVTFPCDHYTVAAAIHQQWHGDVLYLEALREIILHYPEVIVIENVWGFRKFRRVIETFRALPLYHCTELLVHGEDFTLQRKKRVFLLLHRQPFRFPPIEQYACPRSRQRLRDYLDLESPPPPIPAYVYARLDGNYRDRPVIYDPEQTAPVNLFTNYRRDRSLFLIKDPRCPRGVRPFSVREVSNLHGFPASYQFLGPLGEAYDMVIDAVMPPVAQAIGMALRDSFQAIERLADVPRSLGYRDMASPRERQEELQEALRIVQAPDPIDPKATQQLPLWETA
ncbi:DNA (cytosine-5)-methyltransferase 1 [Thermosporothrix hazakensis]|jgi:DNA (cytosine-5)-methyltransferase 1|uniref:DNA (cytosine-5-)-methyltransferase n=1 Tax=Thermosporothrix hazakensis TaxID=644383 RepID=A0A326U5Y3_THEHA|nr:DNA cytosine methyltransferase [Thermosporothrix hazakensis]PZW28354.1 DNA (cytosine-5)-methyltransferase 1 [Thermosporothrix hazakensis]GCE46286.1 hypothetical protein KTH_11550 [Thermosporothrix hazakensis]